jgi:dephospho-CoA kinase
MLSIGLTGGIGSGKSTVARVFETLGIPVYYADDAAKRLMNEDGPLKDAITRHFGAEAYRDGRLDRAWLGAQVFGNPERLQLLNSLVHPATIADAAAWMHRQQSPYAIKEAALLFESNGDEALDYVIGVSAPEAERIRRVMERDGADEASIRKRMAGQLDESEKMRRCDFVIVNDGQQMVIPQVLQIHEELVRRSANA